MQLMSFKGINAIYPCRFCEMKAVQNPAATRTPYYMTTLSQNDAQNPDYLNLPLRTDYSIKATAYKIETTSNQAQKQQLQKDCGINGQVCDTLRCRPDEAVH
jgi:hypothetical protein